MRLSDLLDRAVHGQDGARIGRLADIVVSLADPHPRATELLIRSRDGLSRAPWSAVATLGPGRVELREPPRADAGRDRDGLWLRRDVLDAQMIDVAGRRVRRIADVELAGRGRALHVLAVDVSVTAVLRRLGLRRLASRTASVQIDWRDVHLASGPGHALQLASPAAAVHRLSGRELAAVAAALPPARAQELLDRVAASHVDATAATGRRRRRFPHRRGRDARA